MPVAHDLWFLPPSPLFFMMRVGKRHLFLNRPATRGLHLLATGFLNSTDRVVLFNTGGGLKYTDVTAEAMGLKRPDASS
jgi:hypothetical protein